MIKTFKRRRAYARFRDNIWAVVLAEIRIFSSKILGVKYLLCVIDIFIKYAWVRPLKDKKAKTVIHGFVEVVNKSKRKPDELRVDQEKKFYNSSMQKWLDNNDILMYSTQKVKSAVSERFIRTLESKTYYKITANNNFILVVLIN